MASFLTLVYNSISYGHPRDWSIIGTFSSGVIVKHLLALILIWKKLHLPLPDTSPPPFTVPARDSRRESDWIKPFTWWRLTQPDAVGASRRDWGKGIEYKHTSQAHLCHLPVQAAASSSQGTCGWEPHLELGISPADAFVWGSVWSCPFKVIWLD